MGDGIAAIGVGGLAVACCAAAPVAAVALGGIALVPLLGLVGGLLLAVAGGALLFSGRRARREPVGRIGCDDSTPASPAQALEPRGVRVELLYFDGCPNHEALLPRLRAILAAEGVGDEVELRRVESLEAAERERFLGSPTVRIHGEDVDPGAGARTDFGLKCRLYRTEEGASGVPPEEWIIAAVRSRALRVKAQEPR